MYRAVYSVVRKELDRIYAERLAPARVPLIEGSFGLLEAMLAVGSEPASA